MMDSGELAYSGESALPCAFMGTDQVDAASFILLVPEGWPRLCDSEQLC
jgi:hypothetical protein